MRFLSMIRLDENTGQVRHRVRGASADGPTSEPRAAPARRDLEGSVGADDQAVPEPVNLQQHAGEQPEQQAD